MKPFGRTDFERAFRPGEIFMDSQAGEMIARQHSVGRLILPSGNIIACDPSYLRHHDDLTPFTRTVAPGAYPVIIALVDYSIDNATQSSLITCARIDFTSEKPNKWELAVVPGQDLSTLPLGRSFGFGVDCGMGCFLDEETRKEIAELSNFDAIGHQLTRPCANITLNGLTGANLIAFHSGYGDGEYSSYWGLDEEGTLCCLVTDFEVLVENVEDEAQFTIPAWKEAALIHPDFDHIGMTVQYVPQDQTRHSLSVQMIGDCPTIIIRDGQKEYHSDQLVLYQYGGNQFEYHFTFEKPLSDAATITVQYLLGVKAL